MDADADLLYALSGFLYSHNIKLSTPNVEKLLEDGFDLDAVFWMIEKTEEAHANNPTSYFKSVWEDKCDKGATTISAIRKAECESEAYAQEFDRDVEWWRKAFTEFQRPKM